MEATNSIIKSHVLWSIGTGMIPLPIVDIVATISIQVDMLKELSEAHNIEFKKRKGRSIVQALVSSLGAGYIASSLIKSIPGLGTLVGISIRAIASGASTYALGTIINSHFSNGGTLDDFDIKKSRTLYKEKVKEGKQKAKEWKNEAEVDDSGYYPPLDREQVRKKLNILEEKKKKGTITDSEYKMKKEKLFQRLYWTAKYGDW